VLLEPRGGRQLLPPANRVAKRVSQTPSFYLSRGTKFATPARYDTPFRDSCAPPAGLHPCCRLAGARANPRRDRCRRRDVVHHDSDERWCALGRRPQLAGPAGRQHHYVTTGAADRLVATYRGCRDRRGTHAGAHHSGGDTERADGLPGIPSYLLAPKPNAGLPPTTMQILKTWNSGDQSAAQNICLLGANGQWARYQNVAGTENARCDTPTP
jgi:hypothetical protein